MGCYPCIEPIYKNLYVKANIAASSRVVNDCLVRDLKGARPVGRRRCSIELKYYDGNVADDRRHSGSTLKASVTATAFEIDPIVRCSRPPRAAEVGRSEPVAQPRS